jgi:hypothetical protein
MTDIHICEFTGCSMPISKDKKLCEEHKKLINTTREAIHWIKVEDRYITYD